MIFRGGRALARLPLISSIGLDNRCVSLLAPYLERVASLGNTSGGSHQFKSEPQSAPTRPLLCRTYATKAVSRPKAHTGRTTSAPKKKATTTKATTPKSPSKPKTSATKKTKGSSKPRTKAKSTKARTRKAKAKSKPKKKALTVEQKEARKKKQAADKLKELKAIALVPPKGQPSTAWMVISSETHKDQRTAPGGENSSAKAASAKYRAFTPEQREVRSSFHSLMRHGFLLISISAITILRTRIRRPTKFIIDIGSNHFPQLRFTAPTMRACNCGERQMGNGPSCMTSERSREPGTYTISSTDSAISPATLQA